VRHGESTWNQARRFQGARDAELSPQGREQAARLAAALAGEAFDALYTSPLSRARDTAAACAAALGLSATAVADLGEVGLGDWEGLSVEAVPREEADADRAPHADRRPTEIEGFPERLPDPLGDRLGNDHGGLVAARRGRPAAR